MRRFRYGLTTLFLLVNLPVIVSLPALGQTPKQRPDSPAQRGPINPTNSKASLGTSFHAADGEYEAHFRRYLKAFREAKTDLQKRDAVLIAPDRLAFSRRFERLAEEDPKDPVALEAFCRAFQLAAQARLPMRGKRTAEEFLREQQRLKGRIIERLQRDFLLDPRLKDHISQMGLETGGAEAESFVRQVLARNPDRTVQGLAYSLLASTMSLMVEEQEFFRKNPDLAQEFESRYGPAALAWVRSHDPAAAEAEAVALHERVLARYANVRLYPAYPEDQRTIERSSRVWLESRRNLGVGRVAPEIEGKDVDGHPIKKLSDYRGKVVVLVFWASWCGPCMSEVPFERELVKSMAGRPFVLVGVNLDYTAQNARSAIKKESISWPNWYDGDPRTIPPIMDRYKVLGIPAVFLIDQEGVIRARDLRGRALRDMVEKLVKAHEKRTAVPADSSPR